MTVQIKRHALRDFNRLYNGHILQQRDGRVFVSGGDSVAEGGVLLCPDHSDRLLVRLHPMTLRNLHKHFVGVLVNNIAVSSTGGNDLVVNDHKTGMQDQMISLANLGNLSGFVGMLTDSRSFLSYTRHEYFRRTLCRMIGDWVTEGLYPFDLTTLGKIVEDISYYNTVKFFQFDEPEGGSR